MKVKVKCLVMLVGLLPILAQAYDSGSTGADGAFNPTTDVWVQLPPNGVFNFTSVTIPTGVTVRFKRNASNTPVMILASGDVSVAGVLDVSGATAPTVGTDGTYPDLSDDGLPGLGGPGGFDGGRGGNILPIMAADRIPGWANPADYVGMFGGSGQGPGGGGGGKLGVYYNGNFIQFSIGGLGGSYVVPALQNVFAEVAKTDSSNKRYFSSQIGAVYGSAWLRPLLGGSGGGGGAGRNILTGTGGGGGGGALLIAASGKVAITGSVLANGGNGGAESGRNVGTSSVIVGGTGGGGAGGAIRIVAGQIEGGGTLSALGGSGGVCLDSCANNLTYSPNTFPTYQIGSSGSYGRIRLESLSLSFNGKSTPTAATSPEMYPAVSEQLPALKIASVAEKAAPANPTGSIDLILPADLTNPVTVTFTTTGVPLGNQIQLTVLPAYGDKIVVTSTPISGTTQSGTASAQVSLPAGSSVLMASTTYTVTLAMGQALSQFANNEQVEKLTLLASINNQQQVKLITVTGKEYIVPSSALAAVLG